MVVGKRRSFVQRLWSDDNEIELLEGMVNYRAINDANPAEDVAAYVKKSLHMKVMKAQLVDKMKRLRKKYCSMAG